MKRLYPSHNRDRPATTVLERRFPKVVASLIREYAVFALHYTSDGNKMRLELFCDETRLFRRETEFEFWKFGNPVTLQSPQANFLMVTPNGSMVECYGIANELSTLKIQTNTLLPHFFKVRNVNLIASDSHFFMTQDRKTRPHTTAIVQIGKTRSKTLIQTEDDIYLLCANSKYIVWSENSEIAYFEFHRRHVRKLKVPAEKDHLRLAAFPAFDESLLFLINSSRILLINLQECRIVGILAKIMDWNSQAIFGCQ